MTEYRTTAAQLGGLYFYLRQLSQQHPEQRIGQLLANAASMVETDLFFLENEPLLDVLSAWMDEGLKR